MILLPGKEQVGHDLFQEGLVGGFPGLEDGVFSHHRRIGDVLDHLVDERGELALVEATGSDMTTPYCARTGDRLSTMAGPWGPWWQGHFDSRQTPLQRPLEDPVHLVDLPAQGLHVGEHQLGRLGDLHRIDVEEAIARAIFSSM